MRVTELIDDVELSQFEEFRLWLNEENILYEHTDQAAELLDFLKHLSKDPIVNQSFWIASVIWMAGPDMIYITTFNDPFEIVKILPSHLIVKDINGRIKQFPEQVGTVIEKTHCTLLFDSKSAKLHALTMLKLKFSDWQIREKVL